MTERKPPGVPFESWVDRKIREAEENGAFSSLPGFGKPLAALDAPYDDLWWVKDKLHREGVSILPPALQLRKDTEDALIEARTAPSERAVRELLDGVNERIEAMLRRPPPGPMLDRKPVDVDAFVAEWRAEREADSGAQGPPH
ncbi:MAG: DUF1992 domain-containing protein [Streptomycetaceae bacterium]|nr:DUF1992 domain-containing protein [Streptomycetaceae bacterium]